MRRGFARAQGVDVRFDPVKEGHVGDRAVLDHLGQPGSDFALRQGRKRRQIGDDAQRLVKRADHVLAARVVDRRLATDRRVDLRQQRRRQLDERHAALVARRRETGHVADDTAAQRDQRRRTFATAFEQHVEDAVERLPVLEALAVGQHHLRDIDANVFQLLRQPLEIECGDRRIADDGDLRLAQLREQKVGAREQPLPDMDRVRASGQGDLYSFHRAPISLVNSCRIPDALPRPPSTTRSATSR